MPARPCKVGVRGGGPAADCDPPLADGLRDPPPALWHAWHVLLSRPSCEAGTAFIPPAAWQVRHCSRPAVACGIAGIPPVGCVAAPVVPGEPAVDPEVAVLPELAVPGRLLTY